jgi:hypothetical protein
VVFRGVGHNSNINGDFISVLKEEVNNFKNYQIDASLGDIDLAVWNLLDVSIFVVGLVAWCIVIIGGVVVCVCSWGVLT